MATFYSPEQLNLRFQLGSGTDIGGGRENQDDCFIWIKREENLIVLGVLDGHGREVGRIASSAAKAALTNLLDAEYLDLSRSPVDFLTRAHELAHEHIRNAFKQELEKQGYELQQSEDGYLMKRRLPTDFWSCVHGGTSCTLIAVVTHTLYVANVGDSSAVLCVAQPVLERGVMRLERDAAVVGMPDAPKDGSVARDISLMEQSNAATQVMVITAEHSPESAYEFERLRHYRPRDGDPTQPALFVVYDSPSHDKSQCNPVFDPTSDKLTASQRGRQAQILIVVDRRESRLILCTFVYH